MMIRLELYPKVCVGICCLEQVNIERKSLNADINYDVKQCCQDKTFDFNNDIVKKMSDNNKK